MSPELYLLECIEDLFQTSLGEALHLVDELLPILRRTGIAFYPFHVVLKNREHCLQLISTQSVGVLKNESFTQEFVEVEKLGGSSQLVVYKKDAVEVI